jgi:hypothetical protein
VIISAALLALGVVVWFSASLAFDFKGVVFGWLMIGMGAAGVLVLALDRFVVRLP